DVPHDRALGAGVSLPHTVNIQLDCPQTLTALKGFNAHITGPRRRICHWSGYTQPGALRFYARALRHPDIVSLDALQVALPNASAPRWSRMFAVPQVPVHLPLRQKTAS
ncbi:MAG: hypothetical protein AAGK77_15105, partial [Pseudomonadota bacterium]